jgi:sphingomyelin phosphodiesterase
MTSVYVQNNTIHSFTVRDSILQPEGFPLPTNYFHWNTDPVSAGARERLLEFTLTSSDIEYIALYGQDYEFHSELSLGDDRIDLRQKMRGRSTPLMPPLPSKLWYSAGSDAWFEDHGWHITRWNTVGGVIEVLYHVYRTTPDFDVEYVLNPVYRTPSDHDTLNVLAYNVYLRPTTLFKNGQDIRAGLLPERIKGYDVIIFSEAFDDDVREKLLSGLSADYPFHTRILGSDDVFEQDGGVIIVSRLPIHDEDQVQFEHQSLRDFSGARMCHGDDCLAEKGILYARIGDGERTFHIFGTHLQAGDEGGGVEAAIRDRQLLVIQAFIDSKNIPAGEAVIIAGDFNIDKRSHEYPSMLHTLRAIDPLAIGHPYTVDPQINQLSDSEQPKILDYVLYSRNHLRPVNAIAETRLIRSQFGWKEFFFESNIWDLSDHFPIYARLQYGRPASLISPPVLDLGRVLRNTLVTSDRSLTVSSVGTGPVVIVDVGVQGAQATAFSLTPQMPGAFPITLHPRENFSISVQFQSTSIGEHRARAAVTSLDLLGAPVIIEAVLLADVVAPDMDVLPTVINFGFVRVGQPVIRNVLVTNNGSAPLRFRVAPLAFQTPFHWPAGAPNSWLTLPPGESEVIPVRYMPTSVGEHLVQLVIIGDGETVSVSLFGEGVPNV